LALASVLLQQCVPMSDAFEAAAVEDPMQQVAAVVVVEGPM
jgi:hypothetical protein